MSWSYKMDWCLEQGLEEEQVQLFIITKDLDLVFRLARCGFGELSFLGVDGKHKRSTAEPQARYMARRQVCMSRAT